jgi:glucokinase
MAPDSAYIGIDVGGTNLRFALVTPDGTILRRERQPTDIDHGRESFLVRLRTGIELLKDDAARLHKKLLAVGAGVPGLISNDGFVHASVNLSPIEGLNLRDLIAEWSGVPAVVVNDANAIAFGEKEFGSGAGFDSLLVLTIGTGVGSGLILNGRLWTGIDGIASEFGHATVEPKGKLCPCGNRGCLEQYASATAIAAAARVAVENGAETSLSLLALEDVTAETIAIAALEGDTLACSVYDDAGRYLGIAAALVANMLNIEAILLSGGVAASFSLLAEPMKLEILGRAFPIPAQRMQIIKGVLGDDAGLLGSAALAKYTLLS